MNNKILDNSISPTGKFEIIYGPREEFGMGGPYASSIYLAQQDKPPMFIHSMCYGGLMWAEDESCFYFFILRNRALQVVQFVLETNTVKIFYDTYYSGEFETVSKFGYTVNGKNWVESVQAFNEGLIICDSNPENVEEQYLLEPKINIIPKQGIEVISLGEERVSVNKRVKGFTAYEGRQIDYYTEFGFHVHYNDANIVEAIEIMFDMQGLFELYEKNPSSANVEEMIGLLKEKNNGETNFINESEDYIFLEICLGIFRNSTPEKFEKYIEQTKLENPDDFKNGTPEWMLEDLEKTKHFQTLIIGDKNYFRNPVYYVKE